MAHLIILPILIPLTAGALLLLVGGRRHSLEAALAVFANLMLLVTAVVMAVTTDRLGDSSLLITYRLGNWPAAVAIVLVADRLSALMVLLAAILGLLTTSYALSRWSRLGPFYHSLSQFLLMGLNGAFLTGDLFNLFVFFEILLAASYGLLLHGSGAERVASGLHYIVINLVASLLFLIGVTLIFGVTGTLNMAVLAERIPSLPEETRSLFHAGAAILGLAFLVKAAACPLGFWLPRTYDAAAPSVAAMFAILTKVGIYAVIRLGLLVFGPNAGVSAGFGSRWLFVTGLLTLAVGAVGMLAARDLGRLTGYSLLVSAGTLLGLIVFADSAVLAGGLFYLVVSTLGAASLYLLSGLIGVDGEDQIADLPVLQPYVSDPVGVGLEEDERPVLIPAPLGFLSTAFLISALLVAGVPPLPGFLAKVAMLSPLLQDSLAPFPAAASLMALLIIASSMFSIIAFARAGIQLWWADTSRIPPTIRASEIVPVSAVLLLCLIVTPVVDWPFSFIQRTANQLLDPSQYVDAVLGRKVSH